MYKKLDLSEKIVCNTVAKTFELAAKELSCYEVDFCKTWLTSDICQSISELDETIICQSRTHLLNSFKAETSIPEQSNYKMEQEAMFWAGYTFTYWMLMTGISGKAISARFDIASILSQYDILHTMSVAAAIKTIEKDYSIAAVLLDSVLHPDN